MVRSLRAMALPDEAAQEALPLLHVTWPAISATAWLAYVDFVGGRGDPQRGGIVVLRDRADYICGLMAYEVEHSLHKGIVLTVPLFTALDLANSAVPAEALLEAALGMARDFGCAGLQIRLYDEQRGLASQVRARGYTDWAGYLWLPTRAA
jgi:hypothetical protein